MTIQQYCDECESDVYLEVLSCFWRGKCNKKRFYVIYRCNECKTPFKEEIELDEYLMLKRELFGEM